MRDTVPKKPSIEPDDGYDSERDYRPCKTWDQRAEERDSYVRARWPGLFEYLEEVLDGKRSR